MEGQAGKASPPPREEIEVFEGRFQVTREQIANICDNYIKKRDSSHLTLLTTE